MEVCYLLLNGNLPNQAEKNDFETTITYHTMVHEQVTHFSVGLVAILHPIAIMVGVVGALSSFTMITDIHDPYQRMVASHRMIAKMPIIAAMAYKYSIGQPLFIPTRTILCGQFSQYDIFCTCRGYQLRPSLNGQWIIFLFYMPITNKMLTSTGVFLDHRVLIPSPVSLQEFLRCGAPRMGSQCDCIRNVGANWSQKNIPEFLNAPKIKMILPFDGIWTSGL